MTFLEHCSFCEEARWLYSRGSVYVRHISALSMLPQQIMQRVKNHVPWNFILWRILFRFVQNTYPTFSQELHTFKESCVAINARSCRNTWHNDDWHSQPCIFAQETKRKGIGNAQGPLI